MTVSFIKHDRWFVFGSSSEFSEGSDLLCLASGFFATRAKAEAKPFRHWGHSPANIKFPGLFSTDALGQSPLTLELNRHSQLF